MIPELFQKKKQLLSFEVFPPKKEEEFPEAYAVLDSLSKLKPHFISVTYGAGGSRSKKTVDIASYIHASLHLPVLAHLTCVGNTKADITSVAEQLKEAGVTNVLALRGDRPSYMTDEQFESREFSHASDLAAYLKATTDFHIAGACYPEKHYEALSMTEDLLNTKTKVSAGCEFLISQLFFDNDYFYRYQELAQKSKINVPICAGIMPITSAKQLGTTVSLSGSSVPKALSDLIAVYGDHPQDMRKAGIEYAINQIRELEEHGVDGIHLYSMNKPKVTAEIVSSI
ncbi:MAG: methylenetetrahydrofolate reductase [Lachnospiraceae bacterium]|nr:methylenetetrahydrofolate reductase [NAD(P)H] [Lachnospiraceae bacterium]